MAGIQPAARHILAAIQPEAQHILASIQVLYNEASLAT